MRNPKGFECHDCAPADWRRTPDMTGSYELDATIIRTKNRDMADRLANHLVTDCAYKQRTPYSNGSGVS